MTRFAPSVWCILPLWNTSGFLGFGRSKFLHRRARSRFPLAVKFYFFGFCYQGCSRETNKRAITTVAATNLRLDLRRRFLFSTFWMLLEPTGKGFSVLSPGLGLPAGDSGLLKWGVFVCIVSIFWTSPPLYSVYCVYIIGGWVRSQVRGAFARKKKNSVFHFWKKKKIPVKRAHSAYRIFQCIIYTQYTKYNKININNIYIFKYVFLF